jgi:hypothetical protein
VRLWLLAILRFAITLEQHDRSAVMTLAAKMDELSAVRRQSGFRYFARTSLGFCNCIVAKSDPDNTAELDLYIKNINDERLHRAFEAVLFEKRPKPVRFRRLDRERPRQGC